jgi:hypothetical protein
MAPWPLSKIITGGISLQLFSINSMQFSWELQRQSVPERNLEDFHNKYGPSAHQEYSNASSMNSYEGSITQAISGSSPEEMQEILMLMVKHISFKLMLILSGDNQQRFKVCIATLHLTEIIMNAMG